MKKIAATLTIILLFSGCAENILVVHQNSPETPSFTVIPAVVIPANIIGAYRVFDTTNEDTEFAALVEKNIAQVGVKVFERPPFKFLETSTSDGPSDDNTSSGGKTASQKATTIDVVAMYPETRSTYIVVTYRTSSRIRIIKKEDDSLVATFVVDSDPQRMSDEIYSSFVSLGFIKNGYSETTCKVIERTAYSQH